MDNNPMVMPHIVTVLLAFMTTAVTVFVIWTAALIALGWPPKPDVWIVLVIVMVAAALLAARWTMLIRKKNEWRRFATRQWDYMAKVKGEHETTTEITVLYFQEVQPTGSWATIRWEKFGYVQTAWIEPCSFSIWPQTVLLIRPDPTQIQVGSPWPPTYYLHSHACLAMAPTMSG